MSFFSSIGNAITGTVKAAVKYNPVTLSTRAALGAANSVPLLNRITNPISRVVDAATLNKSTTPSSSSQAANRTSFTVRPNTLSSPTSSTSSALSASDTAAIAAAKAAGTPYRAATVGAPVTTQIATDPAVLAARQAALVGSGGKGDSSLLSQIGAALNPANAVVPSGVPTQSFAADGGAMPGYAPTGTGADALYSALAAAQQQRSAYAPAQSYNDPYGGGMPFSYGGVPASGGGGGGGYSGGGGGGGYSGGGGGGYSFDPGPSAPDYGPSSDQVSVSYGDDGVAIPDHMYDSQATEQGDDDGDARLYFEGLAGIGSDITSGLKSFGADVAKEGAQRLAEGAASKLSAKGKSSKDKKPVVVADKPMSGAKKVVIGAAVAAPLLIVGSRMLHHGRRR